MGLVLLVSLFLSAAGGSVGGECSQNLNCRGSSCCAWLPLMAYDFR